MKSHGNENIKVASDLVKTALSWSITGAFVVQHYVHGGSDGFPLQPFHDVRKGPIFVCAKF